MILPVVHFAFTSCDLLHSFASLESFRVGPLFTPYPEYLTCSSSDGLSLDFAAVPPNMTGIDALLESQSSLISLQQHFLQDNATLGWALSAWISPGSLERHQPIVTMGQSGRLAIIEEDTAKSSVPGAPQRGCPGYGFQLFMIHDVVGMCFNHGQGPSRTCRCHASAENIPFGAQTHVAVAFQPNESALYVNGTVSSFVLFGTVWQEWSVDASTRLQVLGAHASPNGNFRGSIYQLDLFDDYLNASQVKETFHRGIDWVQEASVTTEVVAKADRVVLRENTTEPTLIRLGVQKVPWSRVNLIVEILSLPQHGFLSNATREYGKQSCIPVAVGESHVTVVYTSYKNASSYFNVPAINFFNQPLFPPESFTFRVVAFDDKGNVLAKSSTVTQWINVVHVNHVGTLTTSAEVSRYESSPQEAIIQHIDYVDSLDKDVDMVRVDLSVSHGNLTIMSPSYLRFVDFACRNGELDGSPPPWTCVGDGVKDRHMTFLATPYDIPFLLASLKYHTDDPLVADNVTIRIYDGSGGMCLSQSEHKQYADLDGVTTTSQRDECYESHVAIRVPTHTKVPDQNDRAPGPGRLFGISSVVLFFVSFGVTALITCCVQRCLGVGQTQVEDDHAPASSEQEGEPSAE